MKKVFDKVANTLLIISIVLVLALGAVELVAYTKHTDYVYKECHETYQYNYLRVTYTRAEAKKAISGLFGNPLHIYTERKLKNGWLGETRLFFRWITMDSECDIDNYIFSYAHELVHLTECVANECYANYKAFVVLYESGDEQFKAVAERHLYWDLKARSQDNYTYGYYAIQYLEGL